MWLCTSAGLMDELRAAQKQISDLKSVAAQAQSQSLITQTETIAGGVKLLASEVADMDAKSLQVRQLLTSSHKTHALICCFMTLLQELDDHFVRVAACTLDNESRISERMSNISVAGERCTIGRQAR